MHRGSANQRIPAISILTIAAAALLLIAASAWAQSFRGSIRGTVTDPSGSVIAGAKVSARNINTGLQREAATGQDGAYVLAELPAGEYTVSAESAGLSPTAQNVQVNVGVDTAANFDLTKVQQRQEQLTVTEEAPLVEASRDVLGEVVDRELVVDLPLNGRDFGKLVALVPGATVEPSGVAAIQSGFGQFSVNGNRDRSNNYTLDGTDNNDPFFNNSALNQTGIGGAPGSLLPIDAIQEFNLQSQFPAEYGRNSGSVVNIITKSGTNQIHGSVFEFLRNDLFDARNYFNRAPAPQSAFRNNNFGASLGRTNHQRQNLLFRSLRRSARACRIGFHPSRAYPRADRAGTTRRRGQRCDAESRPHDFPRVFPSAHGIQWHLGNSCCFGSRQERR